MNIFKGHRKSIDSIAFSADGRLLATASRDATVRLWDVLTGTHQKTFEGHTADVKGVTFRPDGQTIISRRSAYGTLRLVSSKKHSNIQE